MKENDNILVPRNTRFWKCVEVFLTYLLVFLLGFATGDSVSSQEETPEKLELSGEVTLYVEPEPAEETPAPAAPAVPSPEVKSVPEPPKEKPKEVGKKYTDKDLDLLARLINAEGGFEPFESQVGIGSVVLNRVSDPRFPDNIHDVIYAPGQFSVTTLKRNGKVLIDYPANESSIKAAKEVLENGSTLPKEVVVFYAEGCKERWVSSRKIHATMGNTVFSYAEKG